MSVIQRFLPIFVARVLIRPVADKILHKPLIIIIISIGSVHQNSLTFCIGCVQI